MLRILIMLFEDIAGFHGERRDGVADQETWALIETNDGVTSIYRQGVEPQEAFHLRDKSGIDLADTPRLFEVRLQLVFLSISLTALCETESHNCNSTTLSANRRRLHRAYHSGGVEHARAVILARCVPSILTGRPERALSKSAASNPSLR